MNPILHGATTLASRNSARFVAWERGLAQSVQQNELVANAKLPPAWELALLSLCEAHAQIPAYVSVREVPAPKEIAPFVAAISGETTLYVAAETPAVSRLVLSFDPWGQPGWDGRFRMVALMAPEAELNLGEDPLADEVAQSWLRDTLAGRETHYSHLVGTATATISRFFSGNSLRDISASLKIRASWAPASYDLSAHFLAWVDILLQFAGSSPKENVAGLHSL